jgi:hypothetical protein
MRTLEILSYANWKPENWIYQIEAFLEYILDRVWTFFTDLGMIDAFA